VVVELISRSVGVVVVVFMFSNKQARVVVPRMESQDGLSSERAETPTSPTRLALPNSLLFFLPYHFMPPDRSKPNDDNKFSQTTIVRTNEEKKR